MHCPSVDPLACRIADGTLYIETAPVLNMTDGWSVVDDGTAAGVFLHAQPAAPASFYERPVGRIAGLKRFTSCHRFSPFWTQPANGHDEAEIRHETLWLLADTGDGHYTMIVPLLDRSTRYSLRGDSAGLVLVAETGDAAVATAGGVALFVGRGPDPYVLAAAGARAVHSLLETGRLRTDKPLPDFAELFGWCTWDAFYKDVSPDKVRDGLAAFDRGGVRPRLLILDDGWQTWERAESGEDRLTSLEPNGRFDGDLSALISDAKEQYGIQRVLVWHACSATGAGSAIQLCLAMARAP
jgi:raffinose synthase